MISMSSRSRLEDMALSVSTAVRAQAVPLWMGASRWKTTIGPPLACQLRHRAGGLDSVPKTYIDEVIVTVEQQLHRVCIPRHC
jgi:hypothetical protein